MKYKVGDKVKIIKDSLNDFKIGELATINSIDERLTFPIYCDNENNSEWVREVDITPFNYTWEDFLKAPIGTKVTFEDGTILVKCNETSGMFKNDYYFREYDNLKSFKDNLKNKNFGEVIKIEEPTYTIVYEPEETMPEIEEMKRLTDELCKTCDEFIKKIKEKK